MRRRAPGCRQLPRRAWVAYGVWVLVVVGGYVGERELWRRGTPLSTGAYAEMDGPALAELAQRYWGERAGGQIPYIVSYDGKIGFQAAGSIVFDLPYRVRVLKDGETLNAPWFDLADLRRRGALVIAGGPDLAATIEGAPVAVRDLTGFVRPTLPGVKAPPQIYFGVIAPAALSGSGRMRGRSSAAASFSMRWLSSPKACAAATAWISPSCRATRSRSAIRSASASSAEIARARLGQLVGDGQRRHDDQPLVADLAEGMVHRLEFGVDYARQLLEMRFLALVAGQPVGASADRHRHLRHRPPPFDRR